MSPIKQGTEKNTSDETTIAPKAGVTSSKIDRTAPAGSQNALGAESVRDGRPDTDDNIVEAMDEQSPGMPEIPRSPDETSAGR